MYQEGQESLENLRSQSPLEITELISVEGYEPLTQGPWRLVAPLPYERLGEPVYPGGQLSFLDVYIAKIFEISIYEFDRDRAFYGLAWSFFTETTTKVKGGQKSQGIFRISKQLADQVKQDFELTTPESTTINYWERGIVQVDVPTLSIYGEKISKWKNFLSTLPRLLSPDSVSYELIFKHPIDRELEDCIAKNSSTNGEFQCVVKAYDRWDTELNRVYKNLKAKLGSQGQEALESAQLKWLEFRDKEFELVNNIYPQGAGSVSRNSNAYRRVAIVKNRVLEIERYLEYSSVEEIVRVGN
ncbi:DUF1311 domain-containing protein [Phormidium sp. FACHB-592]|uniref:DUF1311 domain-containing protein n=1 Tax=Stenomitos frigidus AS-A4 TaxID=2933935 RepID=A0ABV0KCA6_9CYAN|nr:lysozyme inhibitor LprI family protein [Phormidium sp. FACHB-592]MBD2077478.1 DUF1311 domain-containing protein [Phormidium sp. FACHB-592]